MAANNHANDIMADGKLQNDALSIKIRASDNIVVSSASQKKRLSE